MKIVLEKEDIENIIKDKYNGVTSVAFNTKNVKATLDVDIEEFSSIKVSSIKAKKTFPIRQDQMKPSKEKPVKVDNSERARKGGMASGGVKRHIQNVG